MTDSEAKDEPQHQGHLHDIAEHLHRHHDRIVHRREEEALADAAEHAGFDLETDIGHPTPQSAGQPFDMELDLGVDCDER
jgi:hemerythrin-like domain-containing protein